VGGSISTFRAPTAAATIHVLFAGFAMKTVTDNQRNGELGETLVKAAMLRLGHVFEGRGRLETGVDGTIEFRDPATGRMLGKTVAVQAKTRPASNIFCAVRTSNIGATPICQ
jgi:hypothetical protein